MFYPKFYKHFIDYFKHYMLRFYLIIFVIMALIFYWFQIEVYRAIYLGLFVIISGTLASLIGHNQICITFPHMNEELSAEIETRINSLNYKPTDIQGSMNSYSNQHKIVGIQEIIFSIEDKILTGPYEALIGLILNFQEKDIEYNKIKCNI